ncbi:MAG: lipid-A-disaccharide synthase [Pseudomonadota bacterium]
MPCTSDSAPPDIVVAAGEASGDLLGGGLIRALRKRRPDLRIEGIAGPAMQAAGCRSVYPLERLSVMGFAEVAGRYLGLMRDRRRLAARWRKARPRVFVGIDAPDFNLGLARQLREHGVRTVHYVSPSVWAWRRYRIRGIRRAVDRMLTLFPFEAEFYDAAGIPVTHVGHPLADLIALQPDQVAARRQLGVAEHGTVIALLPGSRRAEVTQLSELMLQTARWMETRRPDVRFVLPAATPTLHALLHTRISAARLTDMVTLIDGNARAALAACDVALLASGTATLEALLSKRPMVITYRVHPVTYHIMKRLLHVPHVGLPNLLANANLVPERLQHDATPERLGEDLLAWLDDADYRSRVTDRFNEIHQQLRLGADERAANAVIEEFQRCTP